MATLAQKQQLIDHLRNRVITVTLSRDDYTEYHIWREKEPSRAAEYYYRMKDDLITAMEDHGYGYDDYDYDTEWHDAFEYGYYDGGAEAPVFEAHTGESILIRFEWV